MAHKRMFSQDIVGSDAFLEMEPEAQRLYFFLGMEADDDGFVSNPKKVARSIAAKESCIKILVDHRFIIHFPSGVIVIKHWWINNYIKNDRYHETKYLEEKKALIRKENGSYTEWIQNGSRMEPEKRIEENRIEEKRESVPDKPERHLSYLLKIPKEDLEEFLEKFNATPDQIKSKADDLNNYCLAKGKRYKNYKAFLLNALKKDFKPLTEEDRKKRELIKSIPGIPKTDKTEKTEITEEQRLKNIEKLKELRKKHFN